MSARIETYIEVERGELELMETVKVEVAGYVTFGSPATYWEPGDPDEVEIIEVTVVESENPDFKQGMVIELTPDETEKAEEALLKKAQEEGQDTGFEPPDRDLD